MKLKIRTTEKTEEAKAALRKARAGLTADALGPIVEREAQDAWRGVKAATPRGWTGRTRDGWFIERPTKTRRVVANESKVAVFLEGGTANQGTGRIYPRVKKFLFIPRTARAAISGWNVTLRKGIDYILRRWVRGIRPRWIAKNESERSDARLVKAVQEHIRRLFS